MLEKQIEAKVVAWARKNNWLAYKFTSPNHRSVPDRLFISPSGTVVFIEFKQRGNGPTALQERELELLRGHGITATWQDNADEAIRFLQIRDTVWS
jgi:hypothetical protein